MYVYIKVSVTLWKVMRISMPTHVPKQHNTCSVYECRHPPPIILEIAWRNWRAGDHLAVEFQCGNTYHVF